MRYPVAAAGAFAGMTLILVSGVVAAIGTVGSTGDAHGAAPRHRPGFAIVPGTGYDIHSLGSLDPRLVTTDIGTLMLEERREVAGR